MARILLGWEFGAGRGHAITLKRLASSLADRGHKPIVAAQNVAHFADHDFPVLQAPLSPRLFVNSPRPAGPSPNSMGDILGRLGADDPVIVSGLVRAWKQLLDLVQPDAVVANFAPFLLAAARGSCPTARVGTGFETPPSSMAAFPSLTGIPSAANEEGLLTTANAGLANAGTPALASLPEIFGATVDIVSSFRELDPYAPHRPGPERPPFLSGPMPRPAESGHEVFVYLPGTVPATSALWDGLARSRLPVRIYQPGASVRHLERFRSSGFAVELEPAPFERIAARSRLLLSHGGHGFVCSGLLAGLPQVVCYYDLEKRLHGNALAAIRLGGHASLSRIEPDAFAASLVQLYEDDVLGERARRAAPDFRARMTDRVEDVICSEVERLLGS